MSGQLGSGTQFPLKLAAAVLMTIPVAVMFFIFQKRIMSTTEGVKVEERAAQPHASRDLAPDPRASGP